MNVHVCRVSEESRHGCLNWLNFMEATAKPLWVGSRQVASFLPLFPSVKPIQLPTVRTVGYHHNDEGSCKLWGFYLIFRLTLETCCWKPSARRSHPRRIRKVCFLEAFVRATTLQPASRAKLTICWFMRFHAFVSFEEETRKKMFQTHKRRVAFGDSHLPPAGFALTKVVLRKNEAKGFNFRLLTRSLQDGGFRKSGLWEMTSAFNGSRWWIAD